MHQRGVLARAEWANEEGSRADLGKDHCSNPLLLEFWWPARRKRCARVEEQDALALGRGKRAGPRLVGLHALTRRPQFLRHPRPD